MGVAGCGMASALVDTRLTIRFCSGVFVPVPSHEADAFSGTAMLALPLSLRAVLFAPFSCPLPRRVALVDRLDARSSSRSVCRAVVALSRRLLDARACRPWLCIACTGIARVDTGTGTDMRVVRRFACTTILQIADAGMGDGLRTAGCRRLGPRWCSLDRRLALGVTAEDGLYPRGCLGGLVITCRPVAAATCAHAATDSTAG